MPRKGRSSSQKGYRGEVQAVRDLNKRLATLKAWRTAGSGGFATRADGHADPYLQGDIQIRTSSRIVEYIEVKVADPNRKKGPITIAEMDGKDWRQGRRILMCKHVPGGGGWLLSMWATTWDDLSGRAGCEPTFWCTAPRTRGFTLHDVVARISAAGGSPLRWGAAFDMPRARRREMLEAAYGEETEECSSSKET